MLGQAGLTAIEMLDLASILLAFLIAAVIAYAAFKGYPKNFSREAYWTAFVAAGVGGIALGLTAQHTHLTSAPRILLHCASAVSSFALLGVAAGCGIGVFVHRGPLFSRLSRRND